ncbi:hypothetical protein DDE20_02370 [Pararhodobacter oceanensis]|uniref:Uncharacterized protein n=1 Tax=Pararhodobacter oceanensis TaxID=2172121 RepID=A0A2T8HYD3_9RHOB|nr:hypothetical protein DDE20_02370 [Pararhodobacter oceanensis]
MQWVLRASGCRLVLVTRRLAARYLALALPADVPAGLAVNLPEHVATVRPSVKQCAGDIVSIRRSRRTDYADA